MSHHTRWVRIEGDGVAYVGPCLVRAIIFWPDANGDYVDIYDGRDATSGKKFCRIESSAQITWHFCFPDGVPFAKGVYVDGIDDAVETTILLEPTEGM